jgi:hypothetical protein
MATFLEQDGHFEKGKMATYGGARVAILKSCLTRTYVSQAQGNKFGITKLG